MTLEDYLAMLSDANVFLDGQHTRWTRQADGGRYSTYVIHSDGAGKRGVWEVLCMGREEKCIP
jgi:hypothetical protein